MAPTLTVRAMTPNDFDDVERLWKTSPGVGLYPGDDRDGVTRFLERNPGLSSVAVEDGHLVGAVLCGHDGRRAYISHLAVAQDARRRGIGRDLVARCLDAVDREGIEKAHLFVFADNDGARAFWGRIGWHQRGDLTTMSISVKDRKRG